MASLAQRPGLHLEPTYRNLEPLRDVGREAAGFLGPAPERIRRTPYRLGLEPPRRRTVPPELPTLAQAVLTDVPQADREEIFAGTARRLYHSLAGHE